MSKIIKISRIVILVGFVVLLVLELYARFVIKQPYYAFARGYFVENQDYGYQMVENFKGTYSQPEYTISIDTNSFGLRDVQRPEGDECFKILALGDSFSYGVGVELDETYLSILEKMCNQADAFECVSVIKAGVVGYSTFNEKKYLKKTGLTFNPQMVLVQFWWDDLGVDTLGYCVDTGFLTTGEKSHLVSFRLLLNRHLRSYAFLRSFATRKLKKSFFAPKSRAEDKKELMQKCAVSLKEFRDIETLCRDNSIKCMFVLIPTKEMVYNQGNERKKWQRLCAYLDEQDLKYINCLWPLEKAFKNGERPFFEVDPHLTKSGHSALAQALYPYISSVISLDRVLQVSK